MTYRAPLYSLLYRLVLERIEPERAHALAAWAMRVLARVPGALALLSRLSRPRDAGLRVRAMGLELESPLGVAAGVDKDATWFEGLGALGFGFVEIGTVTPRPQPGNPRPRVSRLPRDRALVNALGFPGEGAEAVAPRLARRRGPAVLGANVGRNKDTPEERAVEDYRRAAAALAPHADYVAVNVSSPNTPGLTGMQSPARLRELLTGVREELAAAGRAELPLLVKLGPDLDDEAVAGIADLALELGLDGIIAVNTSTDASLAAGSAAEVAALRHGGGVSGPPLRERALAVLRLLRSRVGDRVTLVAAGGIDDHDDAWERILAGATLVQAHTGLVYGGPLWPRRVNRGLARRLRESPYATLGEAVGREPDRRSSPR